jgi:hypothetical protein
MVMIEIKGLTAHQVSLLDEMWACDTMEDFNEFIESLDDADQHEAERLQRLVLIEAMDDLVAQMPLTEARTVLDKFRL